MTESNSTNIGSVHGPTHSGSGNIFVTYSTLVSEVVKSRSRTYPPDELAELGRYFVPPPRFGDAREVLENRRVVFLDGAPGSGRTAAAKMLLYQVSGRTDRFRELPWKEEEESGSYSEQIDDGDRLWQNLSWVDPEAWEEVQNKLSDLHKRVFERDAYLVVVLPHIPNRSLRGELAHYRVRIGRPQNITVLRRYLRLRGVPGAATFPPSLELTDYLAHNPAMWEIAHLAELVTEAWRNAEGKGDFSAWFETALKTLTGQNSEVPKKVAKLREDQGPERAVSLALLLATAMLHGAHADQVYHAATMLLRKVHHPDDRPILERSDHIARFKRISATLTPEGYVRFEAPRWSSTVPLHFWKNMPEIRDGIQEWVEEIGDWAELREEDRDSAIDKFADLCLSEEYRERLAVSVIRWSGSKVTNRRLRAAYLALKRGLETEEHGRFFRRRIYDWSRGDLLPSGITRLPDGLVQVIILACVEVIAVHHPEQAVVRLHHCARRAHQSAPAARDALLQVVNSDPRLRRQMLVRLTRLTRLGTWRIDNQLFLDIADPAAFTDPGGHGNPLLDENGVPNMLADGWRHIFSHLGVETWRARMREWLRLAAEDERNRDALLDPLLAGAKEQAGVLGHIFNEAYHLPASPADGDESRAAFRDLVLRKISNIQGLWIT